MPSAAVAPAPVLPRPTAGLPARRRAVGFALVALGLPGLTVALVRAGDGLALGSVLLLYVLAVVVVAAVGGLGPGILAAIASTLIGNWFFTAPYHTLLVETHDAVVELVVFGVVALVVSVAVDYAARSRATAIRSRIEADLISQVATGPVDDLNLGAILEQVRSTFGMTSASLVRTDADGTIPVASVGVPDGEETIRVSTGGGLALVAHGPELSPEDEAVLRRLGAAAARAWQSRHLAAHADQLTEADRVRSALLAAVGHDLRTPLTGLKAAVSSLRQDDVEWSPQERAELLASVEDSTDRLTHLIANILDMTRIQVGTVAARPAPVAIDEIASLALLDLPPGAVRMDVPDSLPLVSADPGLLERVIANLVDNAVRHSPPGRPVVLRTRLVAGHVELRVTDHGPGVPESLWPMMFAPFQRLGDRAAGAGTGLGLAIVQGFCGAMSIPVRPEATPGGGLTMVLELPVVPS